MDVAKDKLKAEMSVVMMAEQLVYLMVELKVCRKDDKKVVRMVPQKADQLEYLLVEQ